MAASDGGHIWPPRASDLRIQELTGAGPEGSTPDHIRAVFIAAGYTGTLDDMWQQHLAALAITDTSEPFTTSLSLGGGVIEHYVAEGLIHEEFTGDGTFQSSANAKVPAASLTAGKWLFIFNSGPLAANFTNTNYMRLVEADGTPTVLSLDDHRYETASAVGETSQGRGSSFISVATVTGDYDVVLQVQNAVGTTGRINYWRVLAIKLDDLTENTDYFHNAVTTDVSNLTGDIWNDINTTITPTAGEDWLVFSGATCNVVGGRQNYTRLVVDGTGYQTNDSVQDADSQDVLTGFAAVVIESMPALAGGAITMEVKPFVSDTQDVLSSQLFALRLGAFADYAVGSAASVAIDSAQKTILTDTLASASETGDYLAMAMHSEDLGGQPTASALYIDLAGAGATLVSGDVSASDVHRRDEPIVNIASSSFQFADVTGVTSGDSIAAESRVYAGGVSRVAYDVRTVIMSWALA